MSEQVIDHIINHLEFLGYTVEKKEIELLGKHVAHFKSRTGFKFIVLEEALPLITFRAWFTNQRSPSSGMDRLTNQLNKEMLVAKVYYLVEDGRAKLVVEWVYVGAYVREVFGQFWELSQNDIRKLANSYASAVGEP